MLSMTDWIDILDPVVLESIGVWTDKPTGRQP